MRVAENILVLRVCVLGGMVVASLIAGLALGTAVAADSGTSLIQAVRSGAIDRVRELAAGPAWT